MALTTENRVRLIIENFLSVKNVSDELTAGFLTWLLSEEHLEEKMYAVEALLESDIRFEPNPGEDTLEAYKKIAQKLGFREEDDDRGMRGGGNNKKPLRRIVLRIAAVLIPVAAVLGATFYLWDGEQPAEQPEPVIAAEISLSTPEGSQKHTVLPDDSSIWVNSQSKITYGDDFSDARVVNIDGEAYFNVTKAEDKPFYVKHDELTITVLGTIFNVVANGDVTEVSLYEGLLRVDVPGRFYLLPAKHELRYNKLDGTVSVNELARSKPDWMRHIINFSLQPASDVLDSIGDIYGYDMLMTAQDRAKLSEEVVTLRFEEEISFSDVLSIMSAMNGFTYTVNDKEVHITMTSD